MRRALPVIDGVVGLAFRVPTDALEADGTLAWDRTTMVIAEVSADGRTGLGYTYSGAAAAQLINDVLAGMLIGDDAFAIPRLWDAIADAYAIPLSAHTALAVHVHVCCAAPRVRHIEWFHDHVRIEHMLFDGAPVPHRGLIGPDLARPGLGLEFKRSDAARFAA